MATEIERKFLVKDDSWKKDVTGERYRQGYLCPGSGVSVRVRIRGQRALLTVKGGASGISRAEYEYEIPLEDGLEMLDSLCVKPLIVKDRYRIEYGGFVWEVDEFLGENSGLVIAEIELARPEQDFPVPAWIDREVSGDPRYYNASLVSNPYVNWRR